MTRRKGRIVEPYEVYSVHQHGMAPMGLLALAEATGDQRYVAAADRGLRWIYGRNELGRTHDRRAAPAHLPLDPAQRADGETGDRGERRNGRRDGTRLDAEPRRPC